MKDLVSRLSEGRESSFKVGELVINYPGKKEKGDYRLTINGTATKLTDIVREFYKATTEENYQEIIAFLNDFYKNGLKISTDYSLNQLFVQPKTLFCNLNIR